MTDAERLWAERAALLADGDAAARDRLVRETRIVRLPPGARAFAPGAPAAHYLIVLDGAVRVQLVAESGREILLYRVGPGESCVLTTSCLLTREDYGAEAVAETAVTAAAVPAATFRDLVARSAAFRDHVLASYADRVASLILTMEDAVFGRIDRRLAAVLLARESGDRITATHQALAAELGTAREVVSRQLKLFEHRGLVARSRGAVAVIDRERLGRVAKEG